MTEKDLISKLNNAKKISPDANWLASNRELFLTQIANSGADKLSAWQVFYINFKSLAKTSAQPVFASLVFLLVLVTSSVFGHKLFTEAKPNDSLYIARVISEKAKLNTVLDSDSRNKMAIKFATKHAKDISQVLSDPEFNNEANQEEVDKLSQTFDKEIETVKNKIASLVTSRQERENSEKNLGEEVSTIAKEIVNSRNTVKPNDVDNVDSNDQATSTEEEGVLAVTDNATTTEDEDILIAAEDDYRTDRGIEIFMTEEEEDETVTLSIEAPLQTTSTEEVPEEENLSSSTEEIAGAMLDEVVNGQDEIDQALIEEVKKLFSEKKYTEAIEKLNQISQLLIE